jgi:hypothetical protein
MNSINSDRCTKRRKSVSLRPLSSSRHHQQFRRSRSLDQPVRPLRPGKAVVIPPAFLDKLLKHPVDGATAALLEEKTEGWAAGLRLAGLYLRDHVDPKARVKDLRGGSRHIAEYLASEVALADACRRDTVAASAYRWSLLCGRDGAMRPAG